MNKKSAPGLPMFLARIPRRIPWTLLLAGGLVAVALIQGTPWHGLSPEDRARYGMSPGDLERGRFFVIFTSVVVVTSGPMLLRHVLHILYAVAPCEWLVGPRRAFVLFWGFQIVVTALYAGVVWLITPFAGRTLAAQLAGPDFGPSSGGSACLGYAMARLPGRWTRRLVALILAGFVVKCAMFFEPAADLAHAIGFSVGLGTGWLPAKFASRPGRPGA